MPVFLIKLSTQRLDVIMLRIINLLNNIMENVKLLRKIMAMENCDGKILFSHI